MKIRNLNYILVIIGGILMMLDILVTFYGIRHLGFIESNPLSDAFLSSFGFFGMFLFKLTLIILLAVIIKFSRFPKFNCFVLLILDMFYGYINIKNIALIL